MSKTDTVIQYLKYDAKIGFHFLTRRELCGIFSKFCSMMHNSSRITGLYLLMLRCLGQLHSFNLSESFSPVFVCCLDIVFDVWSCNVFVGLRWLFLHIRFAIHYCSVRFTTSASVFVYCMFQSLSPPNTNVLSPLTTCILTTVVNRNKEAVKLVVAVVVLS